MGYQIRKPPKEFSIEELDRELVARAVQIPEEELFEFEDSEGTPERNLIAKQLKRKNGTGEKILKGASGDFEESFFKILGLDVVYFYNRPIIYLSTDMYTSASSLYKKVSMLRIIRYSSFENKKISDRTISLFK